MRILKRSIYILSFLMCSIYANAQEEEIRLNTTNKSTLVGFGTSNLYDTYLSPLRYKGSSVHLLHERMKQSTWFDSKFVKQQFYKLEFDWAENPSKNATEYAIMLNVKLGGHYKLIKSDNFKLLAGGLWNIAGGVLYNERNSNNPASGKLYSNINFSTIAFYNWRSLTFRGQIDTPLLGVAFSPHYRQSYYEISLRNSLDILNFVSFHNQRAADIYFTIDIPFNKTTLRLGYLGSFYQTKIHNIQTHNYNNSFMIGLVSESISFRGKSINTNKAINSSYY